MGSFHRGPDADGSGPGHRHRQLLAGGPRPVHPRQDNGTIHDEPDLAVAVSDTGEPAAATVNEAAADLDCWLWHRPPDGQVERAGDLLVLARLDRTIAEGID